MAENFAGPAGKSPTLQLKTQAPQTNGREVRNVLGEVQRTVRQQSHRSPPKEDDQMDTDTNTDEKEFDDVSKPDWSALRSTLEAAFGEIGRTSSQHTRFGHIGKDCPLRETVVKQIASKPPEKEQRRSTDVAQIVDRARSLGVKAVEPSEMPLVGGMVPAWAHLMDMRVPAILDTGSMISTLPVGLLARAQKEAFDMEKLEVSPEESMVPVYDASCNRMNFLGAIKMQVDLEGGNTAIVAFHIADTNNKDILLGMNALDRLGIRLVIRSEIGYANTEKHARGVTASYIPDDRTDTAISREAPKSAQRVAKVIWNTLVEMDA
nr:unnamed protein product [Haemonchus contortus]